MCVCVCVCVSTCVCLCVERVAEVATYVSVLVPEEMALFRTKLETCRAKQRQRPQGPGERRGVLPGACVLFLQAKPFRRHSCTLPSGARESSLLGDLLFSCLS